MVKLDVKVLSGDDGYSISVNGVVSDEVDYGSPAEVEVGGKVYTGFVEVDEKGDLTTPFPDFVFIATPVESKVVEVEGVEGDGAGEDEGEEGEEESETAVEEGTGDSEDGEDAEV